MVKLGNSWDALLADEFKKDYYLQLRQFLKAEYSSRVIYPGMYDIFNALKATGKILCVVADYEENSILATSNLPAVCLMKASAVNTYQVLWADMLVCSKDAMDVIVKRIEKVTK